MKTARKILFAGLMLGYGLHLQASDHLADKWQDLSNVAEGARTFLQSELQAAHPNDDIQVSIAALDQRLRLKGCDKPLTYSRHSGQVGASNVTLRAACESDHSWSFYLTATVKHRRPIVVANRNLGRGELLTNADIGLLSQDISSLSNTVISDPQRALGQQVKRPISKGDAVRSSSLEAPQMIQKGDQVVVKATLDDLTVSTSGIALSHGKLGQQIRVRNMNSDKVIRAQVTARGQVEVLL